MAGIELTPCITCEKPTNSHEVVKGLHICHSCFDNLRPTDIDRINKKITKIVSVWVDQKLRMMLAERKMVKGFKRPENVDYDAINAARKDRLDQLQQL